MEINIKNFNNIGKLNYKFEDNKVNFLFGISGSGKSSIAKSLSSEPLDINISIGKSKEDQEVSLNGNHPIYQDVALFDGDYLNNVLISKTQTSDVYNIVFSNFGEIKQLRRNYENLLIKLIEIKDVIFADFQKINNLITVLNITKDKHNTLGKRSKIHKFEQNILGLGQKYWCKDVKKVKWFLDGVNMDDFSKNKCPFCGHKLSDSKMKKLISLSSFDASDYETIEKQTTTFSDLGIELPDFRKTKEINKFNQKLLDLIDLKVELANIIFSINNVQKNKIDSGVCLLTNPSKKLSSMFPLIASRLKETIKKLNSIKVALGRLKVGTDKLIKSNIESINSTLARLGIPYHFSSKDCDENNKSIKYLICHNKLENEIDMTESLSTGEKNLIGLIFFLLSNKKRKLLIIDDPASSFDEYRRKSIFNFIFEFQGDSTILVLSHDHIFAKFAAFFKDGKIGKMVLSSFDKKIKNHIGCIDCIDMYTGNAIFKPVSFEDFAPLEALVIKNVLNFKEVDFRLALNIRLLYESMHTNEKDHIIYSYLSAILHKQPFCDIMSLLKSMHIKEANVIKEINKRWNLKLISGINPDYKNQINTNDYTTFEKILFLRFTIKKTSSRNKMVYDELSNIVHLNETYAVSLNPYKFNYFSKYVYDKLLETKLIVVE